MPAVQTPTLFWPTDRKLFRRRARSRLLVPAVALALVALAALAFGPSAWH